MQRPYAVLQSSAGELSSPARRATPVRIRAATDQTATRLKRANAAAATARPVSGSARGARRATTARHGSPPIQIAAAVRCTASAAIDSGASGACEACPWLASSVSAVTGGNAISSAGPRRPGEGARPPSALHVTNPTPTTASNARSRQPRRLPNLDSLTTLVRMSGRPIAPMSPVRNATALFSRRTAASATPARAASPQKVRQNNLLPSRSARSRSSAFGRYAAEATTSHTSARNTMRPSSRPNTMSSAHRTATATAPVSERPTAPTGRGSRRLARPTANANAPSARCESSETIRKRTVKLSSLSGPRSGTITRRGSPEDVLAVPASTLRPRPSMTVTSEPSRTPTCSENRRTTAAASRWTPEAPATGADPTSFACAAADPAPQAAATITIPVHKSVRRNVLTQPRSLRCGARRSRSRRPAALRQERDGTKGKEGGRRREERDAGRRGVRRGRDADDVMVAVAAGARPQADRRIGAGARMAVRTGGGCRGRATGAEGHKRHGDAWADGGKHDGRRRRCTHDPTCQRHREGREHDARRPRHRRRGGLRRPPFTARAGHARHGEEAGRRPARERDSARRGDEAPQMGCGRRSRGEHPPEPEAERNRAHGDDAQAHVLGEERRQPDRDDERYGRERDHGARAESHLRDRQFRVGFHLLRRAPGCLREDLPAEHHAVVLVGQ